MHCGLGEAVFAPLYGYTNHEMSVEDGRTRVNKGFPREKAFRTTPSRTSENPPFQNRIRLVLIIEIYLEKE